MKWVEKNWVVIAIVVVAYLWYNGSLANILGGGSNAQSYSGGGTSILGG